MTLWSLDGAPGSMVTVQFLSKSSALGRVPFETCWGGGCSETMALATAFVVLYMDFFFFFSPSKTDTLNCTQGVEPYSVVERGEVALVFSALGDLNRTNGPCSGHTFLTSGYITRVGRTTSDLEE